VDLVDDHQEETLRRLCGEAEGLIRAAAGREEALSARDAACARLARECPNKLLRHGAEEMIERMIDARWPAERARK
jgi:hypothetical protein